MAMKTLVLGLLFSSGVFAVKGGAGLMVLILIGLAALGMKMRMT